MDWGNSRKRKRPEHIVESHIVLEQSSQYHLAEDNNGPEYSKRVCIAAQQLSGPDQGVLGVRQQLTIDARIGPVQPLQTAHPALCGAITELSESSCKHGRSENIIAEQVCFGMVCILNSCHLVPLVSMFTSLDASSLYLYSLTVFLFFVSNLTG